MKIVRLSLIFCCLMPLFSACGENSKSGSEGNGGHDAHKPKLEVRLDVQGDHVTVSVETDMSISPEHYGMARKTGEGHIHMYLDDQNKISVKEAVTVFPDLKPGKHTIKVSLHNNDHTPYDVTKTTEFEIR